MVELGVLKLRMTAIRMKPAASSLASVLVRFGCARPVSATGSATEPGFRSRIKASSFRLSGVSRRTIASTESKLGLAGSRCARSPPLTNAFISSRSDRRFWTLTRSILGFLAPRWHPVRCSLLGQLWKTFPLTIAWRARDGLAHACWAKVNEVQSKKDALPELHVSGPPRRAPRVRRTLPRQAQTVSEP